MDNVRVLKGWTKDERKELENAVNNGYLNLMDLMNGITKNHSGVHYIHCKYYGTCDDDKNDQLAKDIADYYTGNAKFPDKKYRVVLPDGNYLARGMSGECRWKFIYNDVRGCNFAATGSDNTFTMQEIEDIDAKLKAFAVPVDE